MSLRLFVFIFILFVTIIRFFCTYCCIYLKGGLLMDNLGTTDNPVLICLSDNDNIVDFAVNSLGTHLYVFTSNCE